MSPVTGLGENQNSKNQNENENRASQIFDRDPEEPSRYIWRFSFFDSARPPFTVDGDPDNIRDAVMSISNLPVRPSQHDASRHARKSNT